MQVLPGLTFRARLILLFSALVVLITAFIFVYIPGSREKQTIENTRLLAKAAADMVAGAARLYLAHGTGAPADSALAELRFIPGLRYCVLTDSTGTILAKYNAPEALRNNYTATNHAVDEPLAIVRVASVIYVNGTAIGTVYAGMSFAGLRAELFTLRATIALISLLVLLIGILLVYTISTLVTTPLRQLATTAELIADGELQLRAAAAGKDEIAQLARSFNTMIDRLEGAYVELADLNKSLERRVEDRTSDLQKEIRSHQFTEQALRESREYLLREQKIFMGGPTVVFRWKALPGMPVDYVSANIAQFGYGPEEFLSGGLQFAAIIHAEDRTRVAADIASLSAGNAPSFELYYRLLRSNGSVCYIYNYTSVVRDSSGAVTHLDGYIIDITEGKTAELALQESEGRFRTMFENAGIGMVLASLDGQILEANLAYQKMTGYSLDELRRLSYADITHPADVQAEMEWFSRFNAAAPPGLFKAEKRYINKSGKIVWGRVTAAFLRNADDAPAFALGMIEDITERKRDESILLLQSRLLKGAADASARLLTTEDFGAAITGALAAIGTASGADSVFLFENGYAKTGAEAQAVRVFSWHAPALPADLAARLPAAVRYQADGCGPWFEALRSGTGISGPARALPGYDQTIFQHSGILSLLLQPVHLGTEFWGFIGLADCSQKREWNAQEASALRTAAGSIGGAIERERSRRELVTATNRAVESDRLKSSLLSNMSHELRTPLNGILGFSEILQEELNDAGKVEMVKSIIFSGRRLMATLDAILDFSQLESHEIAPEMRPVNLHRMVAGIAARFGAEAEEKGLQLHVRSSDPRVQASLDPHLLKKVISHLLHNAIKFTARGSVTVETGTVIAGSGALLARVTVTDTGIGIGKEHQKIIFEAFRQVSEGMGRGYEGCGLGLTISRLMVEMMHGTIRLESAPGSGTTVTLMFPGYYGKADAPATYRSADGALMEFASAVSTAALPRILLVEDNDINREVTTRYLEHAYQVDIAPDGPAAVELAARSRYDAILMDINLGEGMNGIEAAKQILRLQGYETVPVIAMTGYAMITDRQRFAAEGIQYYIAKPFEKREIVELLRDILHGKG